MVAMESCLDKWGHDAAHTGFISAAIPLTIVLHAQPKGQNKLIRQEYMQYLVYIFIIGTG